MPPIIAIFCIDKWLVGCIFSLYIKINKELPPLIYNDGIVILKKIF